MSDQDNATESTLTYEQLEKLVAKRALPEPAGQYDLAIEVDMGPTTAIMVSGMLPGPNNRSPKRLVSGAMDGAVEALRDNCKDAALNSLRVAFHYMKPGQVIYAARVYVAVTADDTVGTHGAVADGASGLLKEYHVNVCRSAMGHPSLPAQTPVEPEIWYYVRSQEA